ncbi:MAG: hypothetical protein ACK58L_19755 [Planctomycetota bacterium]
MLINDLETKANAVPLTMHLVLRFMVSGFMMLSCVDGTVFGQDDREPMVGLGLSFRNAALEERFTRSRSEQEAVAKTLLNSHVTGRQTTLTRTRIRILPATDGIRFDVMNSGDVSSQTTGVNSQALVESSGQQHFEAIKPFWFDGNQFLTKPAYGKVEALQTPQRVVSAVGARMPILSGVGDRIAWSQVVRRGGEINQAVAEDVSRDVFPKVDQIVDRDFADLGQQWKSLQARAGSLLAGNRLTWAARSGQSSSLIWVINRSAKLAASDVLRIGNSLKADEDLAFFISEEFLNELLASHVRGGMLISDQQLQTIQDALDPSADQSLSDVLNRLGSTVRQLQSEQSEAVLFSVEIPEEKPLQIRFRDGQIHILATFQVHPRVGNPSGWMTTSFRVVGRKLSDDDWTMSVRGVDVNPAEAEKNQKSVAGPPDTDLRMPLLEVQRGGVMTVAAGTVWDTVIRSTLDRLAREIPEARLPLEFSAGDALPGAKFLRIVQVDSDRGLLRCSFRFR